MFSCGYKTANFYHKQSQISANYSPKENRSTEFFPSIRSLNSWRTFTFIGDLHKIFYIFPPFLLSFPLLLVFRPSKSISLPRNHQYKKFSPKCTQNAFFSQNSPSHKVPKLLSTYFLISITFDL